jgi:REP element-mobilizing transposase RayT
MSNSLAHTKWECKYYIVFTPKELQVTYPYSAEA